MFVYLCSIRMKILKIILINLLVTLVLAEGGLRLLGFTSLYPYAIVSAPQNCLLPSEEMGFTLNPGAYSITINEKLRYTATHVENKWCTARTTGSRSLLSSSSDSLIVLTGCSFTYGMGVDDSLTYPYRLQAQFPNFNIVNAAVPAHGTLQTLLLLDRLIELDIRPQLLIYHYIDDHKNRNILARSFTQLLGRESRVNNATGKDLTHNAQFPYGKLDDEGELHIRHSGLHTKNLFASLRTHSALINQLEYIYDRLFAQKTKAKQVTEAAILAIKAHCEANGIPFLIALLKEDSHQSMSAFCAQKGINTVDLSIDYTDKSLLNLPYDGHPNGVAHGIWAEKMRRYLSK
ncbi:MAG: hypothetical protein IPJ40_00710 [Saprospirales bacterium]|nr:hypothetical protein [Saprospirales bacterium]